MWAMKPSDRQELEEYRSSGLTPAQVKELAQGVYPDSEDRAPMPPLNTFVEEPSRTFPQSPIYCPVCNRIMNVAGGYFTPTQPARRIVKYDCYKCGHQMEKEEE